MKKIDEATIRSSCWNRAKMYEFVFVLLARDIAAPATIRFWARERVNLGKNNKNDSQILEALQLASNMEKQGKK